MSAIHPPIDTELDLVLQEMYASGAYTGSVQIDGLLARRASYMAASPSDEQLLLGRAVTFEDRMVPGPAGAPDIAVLICRPTGVTSGAAIYHIHGGGMFLGDNRTGILGPLDWAEQFGLMVVSVDYRLAPEHPHPAPVEDCYAGLMWMTANAAELGIDPARIIVAGASAGGGLAAAVALMARDLGGPSLLGQMLLCPMLDDRGVTPSSNELHGEGTWDSISNVSGWRALLGDRRGTDGVSSHAAPARATDLSNLAPAFIDVGSVETFRDEDCDYALRIWRAGGVCELHVWPGGFHGFDSMVPDAALSRSARAAREDWLGRLLRD